MKFVFLEPRGDFFFFFARADVSEPFVMYSHFGKGLKIKSHTGVQNQNTFPLMYYYYAICVLIWIAELNIDKNS